jgi:hypothetical protein
MVEVLIVTKIKVGFFSFVEVTDPSAHHSYNEWHQLDHLPEQYPIPGIAYGQRWVATPACQAARAMVCESLVPVQYVALYLMTEPVPETLREFEEVGFRLGEQGRFHHQRRSHLFGAWHLLETAVAPRVLISAEAVPFRPCRGIYVIVEEPTGPLDDWTRSMHTDNVPALIDVPGVVGVWSFAASPLYVNEHWKTAGSRVTVCWLDDDPVTVAAAARPVVERRWADGAPVRPLLAGPLETITPWEWSWFDQ